VPSREIWAALGTAARFLSPAAGEAEWSGLSRRQQYQCAQDGPLRDLRLERVRVAVRQASPRWNVWCPLHNGRPLSAWPRAARRRLDHPFDHPDDPTGSFSIRLDRRGIQREQARSVWSRPDRRRAPGYGSGGLSRLCSVGQRRRSAGLTSNGAATSADLTAGLLRRACSSSSVPATLRYSTRRTRRAGDLSVRQAGGFLAALLSRPPCGRPDRTVTWD
jgi:hypothetical protein